MGAACANAKMAQTVPIIKVQNELNQDDKKKDSQNSHQQNISSTGITKQSTASKQVSISSQEGLPPKKQLRQRTSLGQDDWQRKSNVVGKNPGMDQLLKQREFILDKFSSEIQVLEKTIMSDVIQMLRLFLSHLEQSQFYWTKVWLINKNDNSLVVAYTNNVGENRKIRIIFTKLIDQVSNVLDNYYYFSQFGSYKIYDYSFRLNKRCGNYYVFSEQEYCELCLENYQLAFEDIEQLLIYLINIISDMHHQNYIHAGIKPSNIYLIYNQRKQFRLDISFSAFKFSRRWKKTNDKEFRANQVNDIEDIAILIINIYYKGQDIRQQLKNKNIDFQNIVNQLYSKQQKLIKYYIKDIVILLHRTKQFLFDLKASDYVSLLNCQYNQKLQEIFDNSYKDQNSVLFEYNGNRVSFYNITSIRSLKCYTQYELYTPEDQPINIVPGSAYQSDNKLYFAYENMIGMIDIKLSTESIEDTLEIVQVSLKQYLAGNEKKKERVDSAQSNYQLQINYHSPTTQIEDQFKFKDYSQCQNYSKSFNKNFHDRTYFTLNNVQEIFYQINVENRNSINAQQFYDFLQQQEEFIDSSLFQQLTLEKIQELVQFFGDKWITLKEFKQMFNYKSKSTMPIYKKIIKPLKQANNICTFKIIKNQLQYYDGQYLYIDDSPTQLDFELTHIIRSDQQFLYVGRQNGFLYLKSQQNFSTLTSIAIEKEFGFIQLGGTYLITIQDELIVYSIKLNTFHKFSIPGIQATSNLIIKDCFILFLNGQNVYRIFISNDRWCLTSFNLITILTEFGRFDSKVKLKVQVRQNSQTEEQIGMYSLQKVLYPISNQIPSLFRILQVIKDCEQCLIVQRILHAEFEQFDDCYQVCKYLEPKLLDFFLSIEYDGRIRLNYVLEQAEVIDANHCNFTLIKRCVKTLHEMRQQGIFITDPHPNNIFVKNNRIQFTTLIYKNNIPSIYSDKQVPFMSTLEYMEPKSFAASTQNISQNQIFINPSKANIYNMGLIFLRLLSSYQIKNTKEQSLYLMEIAQAIQSLTQSNIKNVIEEMLKENEEQRPDSYSMMQFIRRFEKQNQKELFFQQQTLPLLEIQAPHILFGIENNILYKYHTVFEIYNDFLQIPLTVLNIMSSEDGLLILLVKLHKQNNFQYKLLYIKVYSQYSTQVSPQEQTQTQFLKIEKQEIGKFDELVNFQHIADEEDIDNFSPKHNDNQLNQNIPQYVTNPNELIKEIEVPIFENMDVNYTTCLINTDEIYFFGFGIKNYIKKVGSKECFIYIPRRQLFKKIGSRLSYFDCQVIDFCESCYLFETNTQNKQIRIQQIIKSPFKCIEIKLKLNTDKQIQYFKLQQNVLAISSTQCWLIHMETFKIFEMTYDKLPQSIIQKQNTQTNTILTKEGALVLNNDGNIFKFY